MHRFTEGARASWELQLLWPLNDAQARQSPIKKLADSRLELKRRSHKSGSADQQRLGHRFVQQDTQRGGDPACHFGEFGPRYRHAVALGYAAERFRPDMSDTSGARNSTPVIKNCSQHRLRFYDARHEPRRSDGFHLAA